MSKKYITITILRAHTCVWTNKQNTKHVLIVQRSLLHFASSICEAVQHYIKSSSCVNCTNLMNDRSNTKARFWQQCTKNVYDKLADIDSWLLPVTMLVECPGRDGANQWSYHPKLLFSESQDGHSWEQRLWLPTDNAVLSHIEHICGRMCVSHVIFVFTQHKSGTRTYATRLA